MKTLKIILAALAALLCATGCDLNTRSVDPVYFASSTLRPRADGSFYIRQDAKTALVPIDEAHIRFPFKSLTEKRAIVAFNVVRDADLPASASDLKGIYENVVPVSLLSIDTLYTKTPVVSKGPEKDAELGTDPMGLYFQESGLFPYTVVEDGYLDVHFTAYFGGGVPHDVDLVTGVNPEDPYELELRHNAHGDPECCATVAMAAAFPLKGLPDTGGKKVTLTLKWKSMFDGTESRCTFDYVSRKDW